MTPIADMIEKMFVDGAPLSAVLVAVRAVETSRHASRDASRQTSRSKAAIRAARYRENVKKRNDLAEANDAAKIAKPERDASRDGSVTTVVESCDFSSLLSEPLKSIQKEIKGKTEVVVEGRPKTKGTRLSAETPLSEENRKFAVENGVPGPDALWAEFIDYWIGVPGNRGIKLNWNSTWRNRVRSVAGKTGAPNGYGRSRTLPDDSRSASRAATRLAEKAERGEFEFSPRPSLLPEKSGDVIRLLPEK